MLPYLAAILLIMVGCYALLGKDNLLKKIIGLTVITNGIHLFVVSLGYKAGGIAPILTELGLDFARKAVDPLPQALVLTSIVISFSITAVALTLIIQAYNKTGSIESKELRRLRG
jgi:multicomponent Na+:H+ antiporter subunit C